MKICRLFLTILFFVPLLLSALDCSVCRKKISGEYLTGENRPFCSQKCFNTTLPECKRCGKRCQKYLKTSDGEIFCSQACLLASSSEVSSPTALPACSICGKSGETISLLKATNGKTGLYCSGCRSTPGCYYCILPSGGYKKLADGRCICRECSGQLVTGEQEVRRIFRRVRAELAEMFCFDTKHHIELEIVDHETLMQYATSSGDDGGRRMGLMRYAEKIEKTIYPNGREKTRVVGKECRIYLLHTMPREILEDAIAHELTHDYLRHRVGKVKDIVAEEGFCELVASLYNEKHGRTHLNKAKELNPSQVYGGGYRKMRDIYRKTRSFYKTRDCVR